MFEGMGESLPGKPKDRAVELFRKIDLNGDGTLTEDEFVRGCEEDKELMRTLNRMFSRMNGE